MVRPRNTPLSNCLIEANGADIFGGGVTCLRGGTVLNSTLRYNSVNQGGGGLCLAAGGQANACSIHDNTSTNSGGGVRLAFGGLIRNSIVRNNHASSGGGVSCETGGEIQSCVLFGNTAIYEAGGVKFFSGGQMRNSICTGNVAPTNNNWMSFANAFSNYVACATTPTLGDRCITTDPLFVDLMTHNFRLQTNSPCVNAGMNDNWMFEGLDMDGQPRLNNVFVDMGAYELQISTSAIPIHWLWTNGLASDGTADYEDEDEDGMNNWEEWRCQTQPTNHVSYLRMKSWSTTDSGTTGVVVSWAAEDGVIYSLQRSSNIADHAFTSVISHFPGTWPVSVFTDITASVETPCFYRVIAE